MSIINTTEPIIELRGVSKVFRLPQERRDTFKEHLFGFYRRPLSENLWALKDINLSIQKGEFISFIGPNGSGKTTLLRLISQVYQPTTGEVVVRGSTSPFVELGVGFQYDLNARDNIYLYGAVMGLSRGMVEERFDTIVQFANLQKYLDQKVKNFSTGMHARLAFSIAAHADADILLVDEALAVGDKEFQDKCFGLFEEFKRQKKTIIFVSHDMGIVQRFSDRVGIIDNGMCNIIGSSEVAFRA